jgi:hypothetical protein
MLETLEANLYNASSRHDQDCKQMVYVIHV